MKYKKIIIPLIAVFVAATPVSAATLRFDGLTNVLPKANVDGYTMIDMDALAEVLEVNATIVQDYITLSNNGHELKLQIGKTAALLDGKAVTLPAAPLRQDGKVMLPLSFMADSFGATTTYDAAKDEIDVATGREYFALLDVSQPVGATALTYDEALKKATDNSSNLKDLMSSVDYLNKQIDNTEDTFYTLISQPTGYVESGTMAKLVVALRDMETTRASVPENEQKIKDGVDITLKNYLSTKKGMELDIQLLEKSIGLQKINLDNLKLKYSLGMESTANIDAAERTFEQAQMSLDTLKISLENQNLSLNTFLGLKPEDVLYIDYANVLTPVSVDLERYIRTELQTDPEIASKRRAHEQAQYAIDQYGMFSKYTINPATGEILSEDITGEELNMNIDTTGRALKDTEDNVEKAIRQTYNQLSQLQDQDATLRLSLEQAKDTYNVVATNYQAGMVTQYEVKQAELGIMQAEIAVVKNIDQYNLLLTTFEHPYFALQ